MVRSQRRRQREPSGSWSRRGSGGSGIGRMASFTFKETCPPFSGLSSGSTGKTTLKTCHFEQFLLKVLIPILYFKAKCFVQGSGIEEGFIESVQSQTMPVALRQCIKRYQYRLHIGFIISSAVYKGFSARYSNH